jgi:hypothetical protein
MDGPDWSDVDEGAARDDDGAAAPADGVWDPPALVDQPLVRDRLFLIGCALTTLAVAWSAYTNARRSGISTSLFGETSGLLDGLLAVATGLLLLWLLPAGIRRVLRSRRLATHAPGDDDGWYADPMRRGQERLWSDGRWTGWVKADAPRLAPRRGVVALVAAAAVLLVCAAGAWGQTHQPTSVRSAYAHYSSVLRDFGSAMSDAEQAQSVPKVVAALSANAPALEAATQGLVDALSSAGQVDSTIEGLPTTPLFNVGVAAQGFAAAVTAMTTAYAACASTDVPCFVSAIGRHQADYERFASQLMSNLVVIDRAPSSG